MSERIDWLYDYMLKFLQSPGWRSPIMSFIEQHCSKFSNEEENKLVYSEIHAVIFNQKFKEMIDTLLENIRATLGVTSEQLIKVCQIGISTPADKKIFHQIFACDNFLSFKKLMVKRNLELEKERARLADPKKLRKEDKKNHSLTEQEQGLALNLSKEAFKGYLRSLKREKEENKGKEWKVSCVFVGAKNSPSLNDNSGLIDLKIKVNQKHQFKSNKNKSADEVAEGKFNFLSLNPKLGQSELSPQIESSEISSFSGTEEKLEAKRQSLKEEENRLQVERLRLEEERKNIEEEKKRLERIAREKSEETGIGFAKSMSILNFSLVEETSSPDSSTPNPSFSSNTRQVLSFTEELHNKILPKPASEKLARLESMFQSLLSN